jgi:hypothetical protein
MESWLGIITLTKVRIKSMLNQRFKRRQGIGSEVDMTLCIAAFSADWTSEEGFKTRINFCSDSRIETNATGSETEFKFRKVTDHWAALFAGNVGRALELLRLYTYHFADSPVDESSVLAEIRIPPQQFKKQLAGEYVANLTGLSFDVFTNQGQSILPSGLLGDHPKAAIDDQVKSGHRARA